MTTYLIVDLGHGKNEGVTDPLGPGKQGLLGVSWAYEDICSLTGGGTVLLHHPFAPSEKGALCPLAKHVSHFVTLQLSGIELWSPPHRPWPPWILSTF